MKKEDRDVVQIDERGGGDKVGVKGWTVFNGAQGGEG